MTRFFVLTWLLVAAVGTISAQGTYRLVSAQVVMSTERPPVLKLGATGPIAFQVLQGEGDANAGGRLVARLYGVAPGEAGAAADLAPFSLSMRADGDDTIITVSVAGNLRLDLKSAMRSNEVDVVAMPDGS